MQYLQWPWTSLVSKLLADMSASETRNVHLPEDSVSHNRTLKCLAWPKRRGSFSRSASG